MPRPAPADAVIDRDVVLPGDFAEWTTLADLQQRYGPHEVPVVEAAEEGGTIDRSLVIFPDDPALGALDVGDGDGDRLYFGVDLGLRGGVGALPDGAYPQEEAASSDDPRYPRLGDAAVVTAFSACSSLDDEWE